MDQELRQTLSHVLWIGGAPDTGKTTISQNVAAQYGLQSYDYDQHDLAQVKRLAETQAEYRAVLTDSLDERWVYPEVGDLVERALRTFRDRFPLVVEDLVNLPREPVILAEGFGFTPELITPVLSSKRQAVWLVPAEEFKWASMKRRGKPSFKNKTSDPERAMRNMFMRDMMLAEQVRVEAEQHGLRVIEVDGSLSAEEMADLVEWHFNSFLHWN